MSGDTPRTDEREGFIPIPFKHIVMEWEQLKVERDSLRAELEQAQAELRGTSAGAEHLRAERDAAVERARTWADTAGAWNRTSNKASEAEHVKELQLAEALAQLAQTRENLTKCRKRAAELGSRLETAHHEVLERLRERDEAHAQLEQTEKERDEFKDFWENATDLAAEARAEVEQLRAVEEAAKVIDALAQQRSCSLYEVAHESWPGQFGQLHRALTTQEEKTGGER